MITRSSAIPEDDHKFDEHGNPIGPPAPWNGFRPTTQALNDYRKMFEEFVIRKPPLAQLPLELQPTKRTDNKPLLHFGFIFTETQFTDCSEKNNLVEDKWTGRRRKTVALFSVVEFLCKKSRALLQYQMPLCMDTHHMISLYSNFNIKRRQLREEDEKEVIEIIKKELCIEPSVEPMWWWDIKHGPGFIL